MDMRLVDFLQRTEERDAPREGRGNFELFHSPQFWGAPIFSPWIDEQLAPTFSGQVVWPRNRPFAAILSHDVDTLALWSRTEHRRRTAMLWDKQPLITNLRNLSGLRHSTSRNEMFLPWLDEEKKYGFRSTFYVSAGIPASPHERDNSYALEDFVHHAGRKRRFMEVLRDWAAEGWEIGLHGSICAATTPGLLAAEKAKLETAIGRPVTASRFHNLTFKIETTPTLLHGAGFTSDSTLGSNRMAGFRSGTSYPHRLEGCDFLEIPLVLHDGALLRRDNLDLTEDAAFNACRLLIDRVRAVRGVITLNWHPNTLLNPGWFRLYGRLLALLAENGAWVATASQIAEWWRSQNLHTRFEKAVGETE